MKFDPETRVLILAALREGMTREHAAIRAGVAYSTFRRWMTRGKDRQAAREFREFRRQVRRAEADAAFTVVGRIMEAAKKDWRAAAWFLSRRFPEEWGDQAAILRDIVREYRARKRAEEERDDNGEG